LCWDGKNNKKEKEIWSRELTAAVATNLLAVATNLLAVDK
jgi:hypothetical protein